MIVDKCELCTNCPNRLFNANKTIEKGIGTVTSDTFILIPRAYGKDNRDRFLNILKSMWIAITGYDLLEQCFVSYDIKCSGFANYNVKYDANKYCAKHLANEVIGLKYVRYIIVFGKAFDVAFLDGRERKSTIINGYPVLYIPLSLNKLDDIKHILEVKAKLAKAITYIKQTRINV